jgi:hypothetical protein
VFKVKLCKSFVPCVIFFLFLFYINSLLYIGYTHNTQRINIKVYAISLERKFFGFVGGKIRVIWAKIHVILNDRHITSNN